MPTSRPWLSAKDSFEIRPMELSVRERSCQTSTSDASTAAPLSIILPTCLSPPR